MIVPLADAVDIANQVAPEHLELHGALFIGSQTAEVFGDYAVGENTLLDWGILPRRR